MAIVRPCPLPVDAYAAVGPGQPRCPDLTLENGDLVTQDEDLSILGEVGPGEQDKPAEHPEHREVGQP